MDFEVSMCLMLRAEVAPKAKVIWNVCFAWLGFIAQTKLKWGWVDFIPTWSNHDQTN